MKNQDIIPLTSSLVIDSSSDLYYYCGSIRHLCACADISMYQGKVVIDLELSHERKSIINCREILGISRKTFNNYYNEMRDHFEGDFVVMMPFETWDILFTQLKTIEDIKQRKTITRVFMYLYYNSMRHYGSYSKSREYMCELLKINKDVLSAALSWLDVHAFISRGVYKIKESARLYTINAALLTEQCKLDIEKLKK